MGLRQAARAAAAAGFGAAGNIVVIATYHSYGSQAYTPPTPDGSLLTPERLEEMLAASSETGGVNYYPRAIATRYKSEDVDGETIRVSDLQILVLQAELAVVPKGTDIVTVPGRGVFDVVDWTPDPADAIWIIQGRKKP